MTRLDFDKKIKTLGLSRKSFAKIAGVSYTGISTNWKENKNLPPWVEPFLHYYEKSKALDDLLIIMHKHKMLEEQ
ncbi:hypothetical protein [Helicobacter anatolicus]|uniref:hypothetical protein n=1 Tax=Helicobacter anatolicus TaxID=2905874 RepID=UPI001E3B8631|nr:hypothetical protein [Helicobacter anatolicus]MCE3038774.1 hypothetical protein [Helicobacter anatolicus]